MIGALGDLKPAHSLAGHHYLQKDTSVGWCLLNVPLILFPSVAAHKVAFVDNVCQAVNNN